MLLDDGTLEAEANMHGACRGEGYNLNPNRGVLPLQCPFAQENHLARLVVLHLRDLTLRQHLN